MLNHGSRFIESEIGLINIDQVSQIVRRMAKGKTVLYCVLTGDGRKVKCSPSRAQMFGEIIVPAEPGRFTAVLVWLNDAGGVETEHQPVIAWRGEEGATLEPVILVLGDGGLGDAIIIDNSELGENCWIHGQDCIQYLTYLSALNLMEAELRRPAQPAA